mmetsp:Transcript_78345/g.216582  ORF Transcript_78345/g.216582 Transcript_78345/m.216582 type:complete len:382 (-) Transcript_78345:1269-2414(-)
MAAAPGSAPPPKPAASDAAAAAALPAPLAPAKELLPALGPAPSPAPSSRQATSNHHHEPTSCSPESIAHCSPLAVWTRMVWGSITVNLPMLKYMMQAEKFTRSSSWIKSATSRWGSGHIVSNKFSHNAFDSRMRPLEKSTIMQGRSVRSCAWYKVLMSNLPWHLDASRSSVLIAPGEDTKKAACGLVVFLDCLRRMRCSAAVRGTTESPGSSAASAVSGTSCGTLGAPSKPGGGQAAAAASSEGASAAKGTRGCPGDAASRPSTGTAPKPELLPTLSAKCAARDSTSPELRRGAGPRGRPTAPKPPEPPVAPLTPDNGECAESCVFGGSGSGYCSEYGSEGTPCNEFGFSAPAAAPHCEAKISPGKGTAREDGLCTLAAGS